MVRLFAEAFIASLASGAIAGRPSLPPAFAIGLYNPRGGYTIGRVWKTPLSPTREKRCSQEGSVACKLIFTAAAVSEVPYLAGSVEWEINGSATFGEPVSPTIVRLLQIHVAVKPTPHEGSSKPWSEEARLRNEGSELCLQRRFEEGTPPASRTQS